MAAPPIVVGQFLGDPDSLRSVTLSHSVDKRAKTKTLKTIKTTAKCYLVQKYSQVCVCVCWCCSETKKSDCLISTWMIYSFSHNHGSVESMANYF